jgi:sugar phosphate isomerase/epimerase
MSATPTPNVERTIERCRPEDVTAVQIEAATLESTAPEYLRDLKRELASEGYAPSTVVVRARFDEPCSLETQREADRIRTHVRAASFLGASSVTVTCDDVADPEKARPALSACAERAHREGLTFELEAPITLEGD